MNTQIHIAAYRRLCELGLAVLVLLALGFGVTPSYAVPVTAPVIGEIQRISINTPGDHWSGGTIVVGGTVVIVPRNMLIDLPANRMTLQQLYAQAPATCVAAGETGLAKADSCNPTGSGGIATIAANRTNGGNVIAGDVFIQKGIEALTGQVTYINYNDGYFRLNGVPGDAATGAMVRLNDPEGRHTVQQGLGCNGGPNCSADPRFTLDANNYTNVFTTGYPICIPSTVVRSFADVLGLGVTTSAASASGTGDVLCPDTNRTVNGGQPVADSRRFAPIMLGDSLTAEGNFERINGVRFLSSHTIMVSKALTTSLVANQPDYMFFEEVFIDAPGFQNQRIRSLFIGFTTLAPADVVVWSLHYDPVTNAVHELPLASTTGCDNAGGVSTCTGQGIVPGGGDIFRIRHDVDFGVGAKAKLNPCAHLRADPRLAALNICPNGGSAEGNITEMVGILSPIPHEIQARTGRKIANPGLTTLDVKGVAATNGQYLFPFGIGLGGIDIPNFFEININAIQTPYLFSGIPWNLDRRLSPGGCNGPCEASAQPLDPFPFEGLDPRLQAPPTGVFLGLPTGVYNDPNFTSSSLSNASNRILSFVTATGKANGNATVLVWPPVDPPASSISATPEVSLMCALDTRFNTPPAAVADSASTAANTPVTIPVLANDSDADGNQLSITAVSAAIGGVAVISGNSVIFTPTAGFSGVASFTYTITDGIATATATVSVTVAPAANVAPVANPDSASTANNTAVTIAVLANDTDANGDVLSVIATTNGVSGSVSTNGTSVTYTPTAGFSGIDSFTYTVSDGHGGTAVGQVTVTVAAAESLGITLAEFRTTTSQWRVDGTSTAIGATVTIHVGSTLGGPVLGTSVVAVGGAWILRLTNSAIQPDASRTVSIESSGGGSRLAIPVTMRR